MEQKKLIKGFTVTLRANLSTFALTFCLTCLMAASTFAFVVDSTEYIYYQNPEYPAYAIAHKAMKDTYKVDPHETNPLIGIGEVDLDRDKYPEIISFPTEEYEQNGLFCKKDTDICPHYILQIRGDSVKTLAIIPAVFISRGPDIKNGYWTIKAYTKGTADPAYFETYLYDKKKDSYVLSPR